MANSKVSSNVGTEERTFNLVKACQDSETIAEAARRLNVDPLKLLEWIASFVKTYDARIRVK